MSRARAPRIVARHPFDMGKADLQAMVMAIQLILWMDPTPGAGWDPNKPWDRETAEAIARVLTSAGLRPEASNAT